jgi:hypothetical protein
MVHSIGVMGGSDCELLRGGWLAQPVNAVSAGAFLVAAACVVWSGRRTGAHRVALALAAAALAALGVGSIVYHGPQPGWARTLHDGSIAALIVVDALLVGAAVVQGRVTAAAGTAWRQASMWMAAALVAFVAGRTGGWLCDPASPLQPHALWHLLSAVGLAHLALGSAEAGLAVQPREQ